MMSRAAGRRRREPLGRGPSVDTDGVAAAVKMRSPSSVTERGAEPVTGSRWSPAEPASCSGSGSGYCSRVGSSADGAGSYEAASGAANRIPSRRSSATEPTSESSPSDVA
jgi:hypothetical protein